MEREEGVEVEARPPAWRAPPPPRRAHEARLGRAARADQKQVPRPQAWLLRPLSPLAHRGLVQQRLARRGGKSAQLSLQQRLRWALASSQRHLRRKARRWRPRRDEHRHRCDHQGEPAPERTRGAGCAVEVHRERLHRRFWLQLVTILVTEVAEPWHRVRAGSGATRSVGAQGTKSAVDFEESALCLTRTRRRRPNPIASSVEVPTSLCLRGLGEARGRRSLVQLLPQVSGRQQGVHGHLALDPRVALRRRRRRFTRGMRISPRHAQIRRAYDNVCTSGPMGHTLR